MLAVFFNKNNSLFSDTDSSVTLLLDCLQEGRKRTETAWKEFLDIYSKLILKIIWQYEHDRDSVMEKYLYVCEKLINNNFAILRKFNPDGREHTPKFSTWLTIVVKNLCVEKHRKDHGRKRLPKAILKLNAVDQIVFKLYYWKGCTVEEIQHCLINANANPVNENTVTASIERIQNIIMSKGYNRNNEKVTLISYDDEHKYPDLIISANIDAVDWGRVNLILKNFTNRERLIFSMRFFEDLSAPEIGEIINEPSIRKIYTVLENILKEIRRQMFERKNYE